MARLTVSPTIKTLLSSFTVKLFVWFWLIAIVSIISTRFISQQISSEVLNKAVVQIPEHEELRQLHKIAKRIEQSKAKNLDALLKVKHKRFAQKPFNIWFKSLDNSQKIMSLFALPPKNQRALSDYLDSQTFTEPKTSVFSHSRLIGPVEIKINNQPYQLFISRKSHKKNIGDLVQALPYWSRIVIPTLISFILCFLLAHSFSKPIRLIKKATTKLGKGDFSTRVEGVSQFNGELGLLANSFNQMAEQLQQHQTAQRRLLGDVSHELRSPMTRLQMALGLAQQESTSAQTREQYLQRCQKEIKRLNQMIEDVLVLSRLENTIQTVDYQTLDFTSLVQNIINDEQIVADEKSISIQMNATETLTFRGDQNLLVSAITNVLTNAVKYSPEQSIIDVELTTNNKTISLIISDSGNGVPEEALEQLFTPFYRVNLARDRNTGGTGLGLAIAKQAIMAHQGKIFAKNNSVQGLSVIIHLPIL